MVKVKLIVDNLLSVKDDLKRHIDYLKDKLRSTEMDIEALDRMIARYEGNEQIALSIDQKSDAGIDYDKMTLKAGVLSILRHNLPRSMRARQIQNRLVVGGYHTESEHFNSAIFAMLSHLVREEMVVKTGVGLYKANEEPKE